MRGGNYYQESQNFISIKRKGKPIMIPEISNLFKVILHNFHEPDEANRSVRYLQIKREKVGEHRGLILTLGTSYDNEIPSSDGNLVLTFDRDSTTLDKTGVYKTNTGNFIYMSDETLKQILSDIRRYRIIDTPQIIETDNI